MFVQLDLFSLFRFFPTVQFNINSLLWLKSCDDDHSEDLFIFNLIPMTSRSQSL